MKFGSKVKEALNIFMNRSPTEESNTNPYNIYSSGGSPTHKNRYYLSTIGDKTIINALFNRVSVDTASIDIIHAQLDKNERYVNTINSSINRIFNYQANIDQTGRAFMVDVIFSMISEGHIAIVPVDYMDSFDEIEIDEEHTYLETIKYENVRVGKIIDWYPRTVRVECYNELTGLMEQIVLDKKKVSIVENPFYTIMNQPNSILKRLVRKLNLLDVIDEQSGSGKLNMIIKLPYAIKSEAQAVRAEDRRKALENQLVDSKFGIGYVDAAENIVQLNRTLENNLMAQVEYLTKMVYSQLGITQSILEGTADDLTMLNYYNRTIEPILSAVVDELNRKMITEESYNENQRLIFIRNPFKLVPVDKLSELADKFTRNEIMTSNEFRQIVGMKPSSDPKADELRNKNLSKSNAEIEGQQDAVEEDQIVDKHTEVDDGESYG